MHIETSGRQHQRNMSTKLALITLHHTKSTLRKCRHSVKNTATGINPKPVAAYCI
jgi:hypothetical protein